jgi:hypothetical protein
MTPLGASDDSQQPEADPRDLADTQEQPIPATREAVLPEFAKQIAPAFRGIGADLGLQSAISKMIAAQDLGLCKGVNQQVASLAASMPKFSAAPAFRGIGADLGLQSAISKMIAAQDLGLCKGVNQQVASLAASMPKFSAAPAFRGIGADLGLSKISTAAIAASHQNLLHNIGNLSASLAAPSVNLTGISAAPSLADLLLRWREVAESGVGVLRGLARAAYKAALDARAAVLRGDDGPVTRFIRNWLDLRASPERIEAVSAALLEEGWDAGIPDNPAYLIADLRKRTVRQGRVLRPIWETQLNRRPVGMLDEPVRTSNGTLLTAADLVPGAQPPEDLVLASELEERRLRRVLDRLKPDELRVTNVYAQRSELTWAEAARIAGAADPAAVGERIRRKLKRLGAEDERRVALLSSLP